MKVLLADDEYLIREGLRDNVPWAAHGMEVIATAEDGEQALELARQYRPDLLITDICMPFMDGIEMIKKASEQVRFKSILLTSYADFEYARRAIEARVCEYLLKPVDEEALADIMKRLGEEIASTRQAEYVLEQAELEGGSMNLEYYMQLDLSENQYVSKAIGTIKEHYAEKISIEGISEDLGVSASYLSRKFKEVTEQTFLDFLNKYRVQQAVMLLNTRQYRISEISEATGFTDYKHFCSVFKKYTLKSPTKFIKGI